MSCLTRLERGTAREKRIFYTALAVALLVLLVDQATKWFFVCNFKLHETVEIIPGIFNFTSVRNIGAAWSMLSGHVWLLLGFGLLAGAGIIVFFRKLAENCPERYWALLLVLSGIAGNSFDRAFHGCVVDFIHIHYYNEWHYPVFNVADMAICIGVGMYVLSGLLRKSPENEGKSC